MNLILWDLDDTLVCAHPERHGYTQTELAAEHKRLDQHWFELFQSLANQSFHIALATNGGTGRIEVMLSR